MDNSTTGDAAAAANKYDDGFLAMTILGVVLSILFVVGIYLWRNKKLIGLGDSGWKASGFNPPPARESYITGREKLDPAVPAQNEELKKLLMRRAIQSIPLVLQLQHEGNSIERLYKRGMLTDDMHFKVKELKAFVDQEFQDVMAEADELVEGWGAQIWPQAFQFHNVIQKQAEDKTEEATKAEEQKKKAAIEKKKEKEKLKKLQKGGAGTAGGGGTTSPGGLPVEVDPETLRQMEAERMAQQLVEEEERERLKKGKSGGKKK